MSYSLTVLCQVHARLLTSGTTEGAGDDLAKPKREKVREKARRARPRSLKLEDVIWRALSRSIL